MNDMAPTIVRAEFLIAIRRNSESSGFEIATRALATALEVHWEGDEASRATDFVIEQFKRTSGPRDTTTNELIGPTLYGFQVELPDEVDSPLVVIKDMAQSLLGDPNVEHVLKFFDTLVEENNLMISRELFGLEMRLRRAISLIYLHAYGGTYYDMLRNDALGADGRLRKRMPKPEDLKGKSENEFFHLLFNHYGELNVRRETRQLDDLIRQLANSSDFSALQRELLRMPIEDEDDRRFLDHIKRDLNPVEEIRNCVMHNRAPTDGEIRSYETARDALSQAMDELFERWEVEDVEDQMPWDTAASGAVTHAMERAVWDEDARQITIFDADDNRMQWSVSSRQGLEDQLVQIAASAFYANAPREDGEFVFECDEYGVVESVLADYEERLEDFFQPRDDEAD